jgi:signal transduction histidine kinase
MLDLAVWSLRSRVPNLMTNPDSITGEKSIIVVPEILYGDDSLRRTKILIVDDDLGDMQFLERILRRVRIENFRSTMDPVSALSLFKEFHPDLVLIDWLIADVNGRTVIEQLRAMIPTGGFIPIVALIADVTPGARQLALAAGANELIAKPIDACEVVLRIANMVQVRLAHVRLSEQQQVLEETVRQRTVDLKLALSELRASEQLVARTQRLSAVGTMASGIAHDFNNALMLIMGSGEILLSDAERQRLTKENAIPLLNDILIAARDAATLVSQLRKFSRSTEIEEVHQPVDLNAVIEQSVSFTKPKWDTQASETGSKIRVEVDCQVIPFILGDAARLRDAITNLIFNAVDAMPKGGTLALGTRVEGDVVLLKVSDTGTGMPEEVRRRCFEPFFTTKGQHGTGLGLAMVHGIAQHHLGTIDITSEPGKGTIFTLRLPVSPISSSAPVPSPKSLRPKREGAASP